MFAIIDFGRYVYYVQVINNAAREGTRYAIVHGSKGVIPRDRSRFVGRERRTGQGRRS